MDAVQSLEHVVTNKSKIALWCSGGKDSTVLAHVARPWREQITLLHVHLDDGWPGQTEHVERLAQDWGYRLQIIETPISFPDYVAEFGWPVLTVPTALEGRTSFMPSPYKEEKGIRVSAWTTCQSYRLTFPLAVATFELKADIVLTGSRGSDAPFFLRQGGDSIVSGEYGQPWRRIDPLQNWSTADIFAHIDAHALSLPPVYKWKRDRCDDFEWPDCLSCTWGPKHWQFLQETLPDEFAQRWPAVKPVFEALEAQATREAQERKPLWHL